MPYGRARPSTPLRTAPFCTALRVPEASADAPGGEAIARQVLAERERMLRFAAEVRDGVIRGSSGAPFDTVINIGIGGSDLGPAMAVEALHPLTRGAPRVRFVSNVDGTDLANALEDADAARTLFIVASKTFSTQETLANARTARLARRHPGEAAVPSHFAAVSTNAAAMDSFGVNPNYRFMMWDWVGGRYSLWSSIGVSLAIAIGGAAFLELLTGAHQMDQHFRSAPGTEPAGTHGTAGRVEHRPARMPTLAVLPYDGRLRRFPAYLQQLDMESNGKSVNVAGEPVGMPTAPVIWGEPGSNAALLLPDAARGTPRAHLGFLLPAQSSCGNPGGPAGVPTAWRRPMLAFGFTREQAAAELAARNLAPERVELQRVTRSTRAIVRSASWRSSDSTPAPGKPRGPVRTQVFTQSVIWGINAFDQWGVELGKKMCDEVLPLVRDSAAATARPVLKPLLTRLQTWRG
jgi:glucose-6-phosphate isomerase